ncbi:hypothetical protein Syun_010950 [Stephania yunnanensis]|uniref:Reticulon-like protein n=1 Tax=Stephania yunnanensis TaxID=152371 RepID=A0AAP0PHS3_9MAGN
MLGSRNRNAPKKVSTWDGRTKIDEKRDGLKVSNGEEIRRLKRSQSTSVVCEKKKKTLMTNEQRSPIQMRKTKSDPHRVRIDQSPKKGDCVAEEGIEEKGQIDQLRKTRSETEDCRDLGVCAEEVNLSTEDTNVDDIIENSVMEVDKVDDFDEGIVDDDQEIEEEEEEEFKVEEDEETEMMIEKDDFEIKEMNSPEQNPLTQKIVNQDKNLDQIHRKSIPISPNRREFRKPRPSQFAKFTRTQNKLQNIVDLVMWKDVSKSALVFGFGTFVLLSSSFTKDLNISLISAISYVGLFYLALVFIYKSILCRGRVDVEELNDETFLIGEEEAIWVLHLVLPYLNEFLLKLRRLFSGDPATTMKLAVMLFVLARCGGSIAIWNVAKFGFFGVFTLPRVCASYSTQLSGYGKFWIRRFRDAWDSCSRKKAVAATVFTLLWNLSSVSARIWAAFMLVVAFRYYQQSLIREEHVCEDEVGQGDACGPTLVDLTKEKKGS